MLYSKSDVGHILNVKVNNRMQKGFAFCCEYTVLLFFFLFSLLCDLSETCRNDALENIASPEQQEQIRAYAGKLQTIKDVLARRHMKVAFFGR